MRRALAAAGLALAAVAAAAAAPASPPPVPAPAAPPAPPAAATIIAATFRGDPARTGLGSGKIPTRPGVRWSFATGGELGYPGQPVLAGARLYAGSGDGNVYALDAATGAEAWRFRTGGAVYASPLVVASTVVVGSYDGAIHGIDSASGARRWTVRTGDLVESSACLTGGGLAVAGSYDHFVYAIAPATGAVAWKHDAGDAVYGSPACAAGLVVVGSGDRLVALREADGTRVWEAKLAGDYVTLAPALAGERAIVAGQSGRVYAFDARTGAPAWTADGAGRTRDAVAVGGGAVFSCALTGGCVALDLATGARRWAWRSLHGAAGAPVVAEGLVYVAANAGAGAVGVVYALDAATGLVQWDYRLDAPTRTSPLLVDGVLYGGTEAGVLFALSADAARIAPSGIAHVGTATFRGGFTRTGATDRGITEPPRLLWTARAGGDLGRPGTPVLAGGLVIAGAADGAVYAFSAASGDDIWRFDTEGPVVAPPTVVDDTVYVGSTDRNVYALDLGSGTLRWRFHTGGELAGAVCVLDGRVIAGSDDGHLHAVDAVTGKEAWDVRLGDHLRATPACEAGRAFVATTSGATKPLRIHAVDLARGEPVWVRDLSPKFGTLFGSGTDAVAVSLLSAGGGIIVATVAGTIQKLDKDTGTVAWTAAAPGPMTDAPAASGAMVIACSSGPDGACAALELSTGAPRWRAKLGGAASGAPVVGSGVLVVPVDAGDHVTRLVALKSAAGTAAWTLDLPGASHSTPALIAGLLLHGDETGAIRLVGLSVPPGVPLLEPGVAGTAARPGYELFRGDGTRLGSFRGAPPATPHVVWSARAGDDIGYPGQAVVFEGRVFTGSGSGGIYAFDERSGKELWRFRNGDKGEGGVGIYTSPTYWNGLVMAGSYDRTVYAVDARTGKLRWRLKTGGLIEASVCVEGGNAIAASFDGRVYAVDAATGRDLWTYNARGSLGVSPACAGGRVYGGGAGDGTPGQLFALEAATGREVWSRALDELPTLALSYAGDALYVAGDGGTLWAIDPGTGRELWHGKGPGLMHEAIAVADRKLVACSTSGTCGAYRTPGGAKIWETKVGAAVKGAPFWAAGVAVVTAVDAASKKTILTALEGASGTVLWKLDLEGTTRTSAGMYGGRIYVGTETGKLYSVGD